MVECEYDVVAIGAAIVDIFASVDEAGLAAYGLLKGGMVLIDRQRSDVILESVTVEKVQGGGSAANTAVGVASLGGRSRLLARSTPDPMGLVFELQLIEAGVDVTVPSHHEEHATGRCISLVLPGGERSMATYLGASSALSGEDLPLDVLSSGSVLYIEGYVLDVPGVCEYLLEVLPQVRASGCEVALSLSDLYLVDRARDQISALFNGGVTMVFANSDEAGAMTGTSSPEEAVVALQGLGLSGVVTRGAQGALGFDPHRSCSSPARDVVVVDTTGAGDLFAAGYLYGVVKGMEIEESLEIALTCAGEVIGHFGARPSVPLADLLW